MDFKWVADCEKGIDELAFGDVFLDGDDVYIKSSHFGLQEGNRGHLCVNLANGMAKYFYKEDDGSYVKKLDVMLIINNPYV
jgi:hypothetical protein